MIFEVSKNFGAFCVITMTTIEKQQKDTGICQKRQEIFNKEILPMESKL